MPLVQFPRSRGFFWNPPSHVSTSSNAGLNSDTQHLLVQSSETCIHLDAIKFPVDHVCVFRVQVRRKALKCCLLACVFVAADRTADNNGILSMQRGAGTLKVIHLFQQRIGWRSLQQTYSNLARLSCMKTVYAVAASSDHHGVNIISILHRYAFFGSARRRSYWNVESTRTSDSCVCIQK